MERRIIDVHHHLNPPTDETADRTAEECSRLGIVKRALLGMPPKCDPKANAAVLAAARTYPDLFLPFAAPDMDDAAPDDVTRFKDRGYVGLKFIVPSRPYNDPAYFPLYERACDLKMPVLFHLGIVANRPGFDKADSNCMRPIHLDHIARSIPQLTVIGAHLGNPWYEEATMSCRWNPNLFFDLSGSTLKKKRPAFLAGLLWWTEDTPYRAPDGSTAWQKIVFGSDVPSGRVAEVIAGYENLMNTLRLAPAIRERIWYGTAARLLGIDPTNGKQARPPAAS